MKKILLLLILFISGLRGFSQSIIINPTGSTDKLTVKFSGRGLDHQSSDGTIKIGTYVSNTFGAVIQTHTNHPLRFTTNNATGYQMVLKTDGFVGVGTNIDPEYRLDIDGRARIRHNGVTSGLWLNRSTNIEGAFWGLYNDDMIGLFGMGTSSTWKFGFDLTNLRLGIGTMTPKHPLTFASGLGDKISFWGGETNATTTHYGIGVQSAQMQLYVPTETDNIVFGYGRSSAFVEKMRIEAGGNVGIGRNNPDGTLEVARGAGINGTAAFFGTTWSSHFNYATAEDTYIRGGKAGAKVFINDIAGLGNVGIGAGTPNYKLQVNTVDNTAGMVHSNGTVNVGSYIGYNIGWYGTLTNHPLAFFVNNGNAAVTLTTSEQLQVGGTAVPAGYKMSVDGKMICTELEVLVTPWPDYVFKPTYQLKPLHELEKFINQNGHLPNIPKAEEIETKALAVGNMSKLQMEKIEELTLYIIEMNKRLEKIEHENKVLKEELQVVKSQK